MTLPLIHTLKTANEADRKYYFNTIKRYNNDQKRVKELIEFVKKSGGLDYAIGVMKDFQQKAKISLQNSLILMRNILLI